MIHSSIEVTRDPATGKELPMHVQLVKRAHDLRFDSASALANPYVLVLPAAHCKEQGIKSRSKSFKTVDDILKSKMYKEIVRDDRRLGLRHVHKRRISKRSNAQKASARNEHAKLLRDGLLTTPSLNFIESKAVWTVTRTFGTGWTFRGHAYCYKDAITMYKKCGSVQTTEEVTGRVVEGVDAVQVDSVDSVDMIHGCVGPCIVQ